MVDRNSSGPLRVAGLPDWNLSCASLIVILLISSFYAPPSCPLRCTNTPAQAARFSTTQPAATVGASQPCWSTAAQLKGDLGAFPQVLWALAVLPWSCSANQHLGASGLDWTSLPLSFISLSLARSALGGCSSLCPHQQHYTTGTSQPPSPHTHTHTHSYPRALPVAHPIN